MKDHAKRQVIPNDFKPDKSAVYKVTELSVKSIFVVLVPYLSTLCTCKRLFMVSVDQATIIDDDLVSFKTILLHISPESCTTPQEAQFRVKRCRRSLRTLLYMFSDWHICKAQAFAAICLMGYIFGRLTLSCKLPTAMVFEFKVLPGPIQGCRVVRLW